MAKIKQSPKLPADQRKMQLLMAAQSLFSQKGYKETTAEQIAKKAGLTKGAIYFHFDSKEDILFELIKHVTDGYSELINANKDKLKSPLDYLKLFMDEKNLSCKDGDLVHNLDFWVQAMAIPRIKSHLNRSFKRLLNIFADTVDPRYGRTKADRQQLGILTLSLLDGLMLRDAMDRANFSKEKQFRLFDKMLKAAFTKKK